MIADALRFVRVQLDERLRVVLPPPGNEPGADRVTFIDGDIGDAVVFKPNAVSLLLLSLDEDRVLRSAEPYLRRDGEGRPLRVQPDIRLNLQLLLVARFSQYDEAWAHLSAVIEYLQSVHVFESESMPTMPANVERLVFELASPTLAEQNEVWTALRTPHHPSLLYRVKLLCFRDKVVSLPGPLVSEVRATVTDPELAKEAEAWRKAAQAASLLAKGMDPS